MADTICDPPCNFKMVYICVDLYLDLWPFDFSSLSLLREINVLTKFMWRLVNQYYIVDLVIFTA